MLLGDTPRSYRHGIHPLEVILTADVLRGKGGPPRQLGLVSAVPLNHLRRLLNYSDSNHFSGMPKQRPQLMAEMRGTITCALFGGARMCPFCRGAMRLAGLGDHPTLKTYQCIDCEVAKAIDGDTSYFEWLVSRPKSKGTGTLVIN